MKGIIVKSTGSWYTVKTEDGQLYESRIRGQFRIKGITTTNPVAVGDKVTIEKEKDQDTAVITEIIDRHNYIVRKATKLSKQAHIIAANIDQAVVIATLVLPRTSTGFIDRILVTSEAYHIPSIIVFNKIDIYKEKHLERCAELMAIYKVAGYEVLAISARTGYNLDALKDMLRGKVSLISGHSGVGKSAILNAIQPGLDLKTAEISSFANKGRHTTTFAEMYELDFGASIIDTPGIKEFGLSDFEVTEIAERFPEMRKYMHDCKFNNCQHTHEPDCAVKIALQNGEIAEERYINYLSILEDDYFSS